MNPAIRKWLPSALLSCLWWGLFGFLAKLGSDNVGPLDMQILFTGGMVPLALFVLLRRTGLRADNKGRAIGVLIGVIAGLGGIAYFAAMSRGKASLVGPVTSLFPLVTVVLATLFLKERFNKIQTAGVVLALLSSALLAT